MNEIKFISLDEVKQCKIIDLMNNKTVQKHLPLLIDNFSQDDYFKFIKAKQQLWNNHGYGPWGFIINEEFAGWGGLQYEQGEADFALILHPSYWGWGKKIFSIIKDQAFNEIGLTSITALLPPQRPNIKALRRYGFQPDGQITIDNKKFLRFRLHAPNLNAA